MGAKIKKWRLESSCDWSLHCSKWKKLKAPLRNSRSLLGRSMPGRHHLMVLAPSTAHYYIFTPGSTLLTWVGTYWLDYRWSLHSTMSFDFSLWPYQQRKGHFFYIRGKRKVSRVEDLLRDPFAGIISRRLSEFLFHGDYTTRFGATFP